RALGPLPLHVALPICDVVACGSDPNAFIVRWAPDGTLLWRQTYPVEADGFSFGIVMTPSGDIAAAGGRDPVIATTRRRDVARGRSGEHTAGLQSPYEP